MSRTVLVTGGAGYIGSHTCLELLEEGSQVVVVDNLDNSSSESLKRVEQLTGKKPTFHEVDLLDKEALSQVFASYKIDAVIHFAGLKAVGESNAIPLRYYDNNITGTLNLLQIMKDHGVCNLVFSSSATVYGVPEKVPIEESFPTGATNPYGRTKLMIEEILQDFAKAEPNWNIAILRYFNPIGAHKSGQIGEDPKGIPNNLLPYIAQVAVGKLKELSVFGNDYPTKDGTGVRDYIHVVDLALGHLKAIDKLEKNPGLVIYNLGTGNGYSVLDIIHAFEKAANITIPHSFKPRREGDVAECFAAPSLAKSELGWQATRGIEEMCEDTWRWQSANPKGYE
ncbi:MAG: UDP-glucose 4-epimerase GalE [Planctomycetes bacterium]|nr:UDP-glucose 4-epimerase GalE [Planctomycetota bacterium]